MIQEGTDVERLGGIHLLLPQSLHHLRGLPDVTGDDQVRDARPAQAHGRVHAGLLVEVDANHHEGVLLEHLPSGSVLLHVLVDVNEQAAVAAARIYNEAWLGAECVSPEEGIHVLNKVFEQRPVLRATADNVQDPVNVLLHLECVLPTLRKTPTCVLGKDLWELGDQRSVRDWHVEGVTTLKGHRTLRRHGNDALCIHRADP
mmetsp:Transcript_62127/g.192510  ORF Transcript_62127/g.192510 Transcript_62127/m.192510 type:complete len:202 (-) Transcript_62127:713-1318(-)